MLGVIMEEWSNVKRGDIHEMQIVAEHKRWWMLVSMKDNKHDRI